MPAADAPLTPPCESPCQPPKYNEDEPEIIDDAEERLTPIENTEEEDKVNNFATKYNVELTETFPTSSR